MNTITIEDYNVVVNGLRKQMDLARQFMAEQTAEITNLHRQYSVATNSCAALSNQIQNGADTIYRLTTRQEKVRAVAERLIHLTFDPALAVDGSAGAVPVPPPKAFGAELLEILNEE